MYLHSMQRAGILEPSPVCSPSVTGMEEHATGEFQVKAKKSNQQVKTLLVYDLPLILDYMHREPDLPLKEHAA